MDRVLELSLTCPPILSFGTGRFMGRIGPIGRGRKCCEVALGVAKGRNMNDNCDASNRGMKHSHQAILAM